MKFIYITIILLSILSCSKYDLNPIEYFGEDLTFDDISIEDLKVATFTENTKWPKENKFTNTINPQELLKWGAEPYLYINEIHKQGFTGLNIHVAIIDSGLNKEHIIFKDCLVDYQKSGWVISSNIHGTIVASILCGALNGVAPGVKLHYFAVGPKNKNDLYTSYARALRKIQEYNNSSNEKIRIVSISVGEIYGIPEFEKFYKEIKKLESQGVMVFYVSEDPKLFAALKFPLLGERNDSSKFEKQLLFNGMRGTLNLITKYSGALYFPCAGYTVADFTSIDEYMFIGESSWGNSWAVPIIAGLAALALEVDNTLTKEDIVEIMYNTGDRFYLGKIPNPIKFIDRVKEGI